MSISAAFKRIGKISNSLNPCSITAIPSLIRYSRVTEEALRGICDLYFVIGEIRGWCGGFRGYSLYYLRDKINKEQLVKE